MFVVRECVMPPRPPGTCQRYLVSHCSALHRVPDSGAVLCDVNLDDNPRGLRACRALPCRPRVVGPWPLALDRSGVTFYAALLSCSVWQCV